MSEVKNSSNKNKKIKKQNSNIERHNKTTLVSSNGKQVDNRFAKAKYDPKFMTPSSKLTKVKIDKRFGKMLNDPSFSSSSSIDRYGRKIKAENINNQLKEYYYIDEEVDEEDNVNEVENSKQLDQNNGIRKWMENYDEQSSQQVEDVQFDDIEDDVEEVWQEQSDHVIKNQKVQATKRLALCNYDWMNITSKDLMILFSSFKPKAGYIKSIKVYMSNLGKQRLQAEQKYGPTGIWKQNVVQQQKSKKEEWRKSWGQLLKERRQSQNDGFDQNKLRVYQKERLKFFYAVIECDSKQTADQLYRQCDGNQFENSTVQFDLRFIPDDTIFDSSNLKEECNQLPSTGEVKNFVNRAMGHSKVGLTWQDPELNITAGLKKKNWNKMSEADLDKIDWGNYIDENQIQEQDQMVKLAHENMKDQDVISDWKKSCNKKYKKNNDDDIEITFEGGFDIKYKKQKKDKEVPSLNKQNKTMKDRKRQNIEQKRKRREQLDLLVDDKGQVEFNPNLHDSRFIAVYENPQYAIDPVDPHFDHRRSGKVFAEIVRKNRVKNIE